jgi:threonine/homoserine/homoserine lactone efflux protein
MPELSHLAAFVGAALILVLTPGPAVLFVVTRSIEMGRRAGLVSTLGLAAGGMVHVGAAVVGLSAVVAASAELFTAIKMVGSGYLIYLGIKSFLKRGPAPANRDAEKPPARRIFLEAFTVNVFNPKPALFFLAFLPQFVSPGRGAIAGQLLVLGLLFIGVALVTDGAYAMLASSIRSSLAQRPGIWRAQRVFSGSIYVGLGLWAALAARKAPS